MNLIQLPRIFCALLALLTVSQPMLADEVWPTRDAYLQVARQGWVFDLRSSLKRRDPTLPPLRFDGKETSTGTVCVFGVPPHAETRMVLLLFERLLGGIFGRAEPIRYVGEDIADCPPTQRIYLRLYKGQLPSGAFNADLRKLDLDFGFGLPKDRAEPIRSPAQGIGFFGRRGNVAHLLIRQPDNAEPSPLQRDFYRSILVEELFQVFTYGFDVLKFDRKVPFISKLQEFPANLRYLSWESEDYMRRLLNSNPHGLCGFDVFMMHALARMPLESSNSEAFLSFIDQNFQSLLKDARRTVADEAFAQLFDQACLQMPVLTHHSEATRN